MSSADRTERRRDEDKKGKATWSDRLLEIFIKIAIQEVRDGNRPTTHLSKKGWTNLQTKFNRVANVNYEMKQLKNKWENLKKEWQLWKRLVGQETGLGWNDRKKTIEASDEWWDRKIREIPAAAKFRERGLFLADEMELVFGDVAATGSTAYEWAPSFGTMPPRGGVVDLNLVHSDSGEGSGDSEDANIGSGLPDLNLHTPPGIPVGASTNSPPDEVRGRGKNKGKRKSDSGGSGSAKKQSSSQSVGMSLEKLAGALADSKKSSDCEEFMEVIDRLPIEKGSEFFYKALKILGKNRDYRRIFLLLKDPSLQMGYLRRLVED